MSIGMAGNMTKQFTNEIGLIAKSIFFGSSNSQKEKKVNEKSKLKI